MISILAGFSLLASAAGALPTVAAKSGGFGEATGYIAMAPPAGYLSFCARSPFECPETAPTTVSELGSRRGGPQSAADLRRLQWLATFAAAEPSALKPNSIRLDPFHVAPVVEADERIAKINARVNGTIRQRADSEVYGVSDYWTMPISSGGSLAGDCEDFVLEKRSMLRKAGLPEAAMSIALVRTREQIAHAVLLVRTAQGEVALDNLTSEIAPLEKRGYAIIMRQIPGDPAHWGVPEA